MPSINIPPPNLSHPLFSCRALDPPLWLPVLDLPWVEWPMQQPDCCGGAKYPRYREQCISAKDTDDKKGRAWEGAMDISANAISSNNTPGSDEIHHISSVEIPRVCIAYRRILPIVQPHVLSPWERTIQPIHRQHPVGMSPQKRMNFLARRGAAVADNSPANEQGFAAVQRPFNPIPTDWFGIPSATEPHTALRSPSLLLACFLGGLKGGKLFAALNSLVVLLSGKLPKCKNSNGLAASFLNVFPMIGFRVTKSKVLWHLFTNY